MSTDFWKLIPEDSFDQCVLGLTKRGIRTLVINSADRSFCIVVDARTSQSYLKIAVVGGKTRRYRSYHYLEIMKRAFA